VVSVSRSRTEFAPSSPKVSENANPDISMIILDTSGIVAAYNRCEAEHAAARDLLTATTEPLAVTPLVLAEVDYLSTKYLGVPGAVTLLTELDRPATVASFGNEDLRTATALLARYQDLRLGLTEAANVVVAARYKTTRLFSLDGHYLAVRPQDGAAFTLLPAQSRP
jgi:predicted nucleic acid-binding protein